MKTKLNTPEQVANLREGDIVKRFPSNCDDLPQDAFDEQRTRNIDTYTIRSINLKNDMVGLVSTTVTDQMFAAPGRIGRLFIKSQDLIAENVWWV
jgi:hypothetical protein